MAKPTLQSKIQNAAKVLQYGQNILQKMSERTDMFPDPEPNLQTLESAIHDFQLSISEAAFRDMRMVVLKDQKQVALRQVIYQLSIYVEAKCQGDPAKILASGFLPSKVGSRIGMAPKPLDVRVTLSPVEAQAVHMRVKVWRASLAYRYEYRKVGDEDWKVVVSSKSSTLIRGLDKLQPYEFRVAYVGADPTITYSDVLTQYVL